MPNAMIPVDYSPTENGLEGKVILVTGAGDGMGKALSIRAAQLGATVILLGRTTAKLGKVYDEIERMGGPQAAIYPLDLSGASVEDYAQLASIVESECKRIDALVHCAASLGPMTPLKFFPASEWQKTLHVNLTGPIFLTQACLDLLAFAKQASIVFTVDDKVSAYWGAYGISKSALLAATKMLADELDTSASADSSPIVNVNAIKPGPMRTQLRRTAYPGENAQSIASVDTYLNAYLYLIDPTTRKGTGLTYRVG